MSFTVGNFFNNDNINIADQKGNFKVIEYVKDLSVMPHTAITSYFASVTKCRKKQLVVELDQTIDGVVMQAGAMQWVAGNVNATSGIKGAKDLISKLFKSKVTGETAVKPEYKGQGMVVSEPTYKHLILMDLADWGGSVVLDDGLFLACDSSIKQTIAARKNLSSAVAGGEGLFNLALNGNGVFCIESPCPKGELIEINLDNDCVKIDGNLAIAWSNSLQFTTEASSRSIAGSIASGEGLVNVYRGTGKILVAPLALNTMLARVGMLPPVASR